MSGLAEALVAAQAQMPAVEKDARNPHFNSSFTSLDHLIAKTRSILNDNGLALTQAVTHIDGAPALETTLIHTSGEVRTSVMPLLVAKHDMQGLGSAITYGKRYAWAAALGISADEDDDGNLAAQAAAETAASPRGSGPNPERASAESNPSGAEPGARSSQPISEPQAKRLWAIAKGVPVPEDEVKRLVRDIAGVESTAAIGRDKYDAVVAAVQAWTPEAETVAALETLADDDIPFMPTVA